MDTKCDGNKKRLLLEFIQLYKSLPCLWNRTHRGYTLRKFRLEAYKQMLQKYREIDKDATLHTVRNRLALIRCGFIRELKKVRLSQEMSSDPDHQYVPSLWYYNSCTFLEDQYCPSKFSESAKMEDSHCEDDEQREYKNDRSDSRTEVEFLEETSNSSIDQDDPLSAKIRRDELVVKPDFTEDCLVKPIDDETECIGRAFALQMRDVDPYQSTIANKLISDTIFYARLGKLTASAYVAANNTENGKKHH